MRVRFDLQLSLTMSKSDIADKLLAWHCKHGRKNLPWQRSNDPYPVWLSEIMLQQTQVGTVIDYFERFIQRFPTLQSLAKAPVDDVLALWSGLGYYARARNLHKAAQIITTQHNGIFPDRIDDVIALPGIGKSTAGAILAFSKNQRHAILDGNVKRVLCRYYAIEGFPGKRQIELRLWDLADKNTPAKNVGQYTQAIMDLGATVCLRKQPQCDDCPLVDSCAAKMQGIQCELPSPKPKKSKPTKQTLMLVINNEQSEVLLEKRPSTGIWGGLWSFPQCSIDTDINQFCQRSLGLNVLHKNALKSIKHSFSHYHLIISPHQLCVSAAHTLKEDSLNWFDLKQVHQLGLPKPVKSLLDEIEV